MAETAIRPRTARGAQAAQPVQPAPIRRRRPLPGGRAVVGGLLVGLSAVGLFAAYLGATGDGTAAYVVAAADLAVGHRITAADLAQARLELPPAQARLAHRQVRPLVGAVVLGPVGRGEVVQRGAVRVGAPGPGEGGDDQELSFALDASRALGGRLRPGELVDVLATYGSGPEAYTVVVARAVRVADVSGAAGGLAGGDGPLFVTLALPASAASVAVAHAVDTAAVTLARTSAGSDGGGPAAPYRAPGAGTAAPAPAPLGSAPPPEAPPPPPVDAPPPAPQ